MQSGLFVPEIFTTPAVSARFGISRWLIHLSLVVIMAGALVTHFYGKEGRVSLRKDYPVNAYYAGNEGENEQHIRVRSLPYILNLESFWIETTEGGQVADYVAMISGQEVRMNQPFSQDGYRLYIMNYDDDQCGVNLLVSYDPIGRGLTYAGYALLALSLLLNLWKTRKKKVTSQATKGWQRTFLYLLALGASFCFIYRWSLVGYFPLASGADVLFFCVLLCLWAAAVGRSPSKYLIVGSVFLVASLFSGWNLTQAEATLPVLRSPWLAVHVSVVMMAYVVLACLVITPSRRMLRIGVSLLAIGMMLGALWADQSWGRYWGWDPKETSALITLLVYALPLHSASIKWFAKENHLRWYLRLAFMMVLFTYFGVNYLLGGLHSYA